jgi:hypothetical protein
MCRARRFSTETLKPGTVMPRSHTRLESPSEQRKPPVIGGEEADDSSGESIAGAPILHVAALALAPFVLLALMILLDGFIRP